MQEVGVGAEVVDISEYGIGKAGTRCSAAQQGVRGVRDGETFSIREWAGLWNGGAHYLRGEQVFLFLYPPSQLGLTSPVRGPSGHFSVDREGQVLLQLSSPSKPTASSPIHAGSARRIAERDFARLVRRAAGE